MQKASLIKKLDKLNIPHRIYAYNAYNKAVIFTINGRDYHATFTEGKPNIEDFSSTNGYDDADQKYFYTVYSNFKQLLYCANRS